MRRTVPGAAVWLVLAALLWGAGCAAATREDRFEAYPADNVSQPELPPEEALKATVFAAAGVTPPAPATPVYPGPPPDEDVDMHDEPALPLPEDPGTARLVNLARADLAGRLDAAVAEIELLSFEHKVWSDPSMGCPQPGMRYIQVPQDGYLIRLRAQGRVYNYHGGGTRAPFLCEQKGLSGGKGPAPGDELLPPPGFDQ